MTKEKLENEQLEENDDLRDIRQIRVYAKEVETEKGKFMSFNRVKKLVNNVYTQVKFTRDALGDMECKLPSKNGYYLIEVDIEALSFQEGKMNEDGKQFNTLWIRDGLGVISIKPDIRYTKEMEKKRKEKLEDEINETNVLPF